MQTSSKAEFYALLRFLASLFVICALTLADLSFTEQIPWIVYALIGALNGVDLYNLVKEKKNG